MGARPERRDRLGPQHARLRVRALIVTGVACVPRPEAAFMRHHGVVPRGQASAERCAAVCSMAGAEHCIRIHLTPILSQARNVPSINTNDVRPMRRGAALKPVRHRPGIRSHAPQRRSPRSRPKGGARGEPGHELTDGQDWRCRRREFPARTATIARGGGRRGSSRRHRLGPGRHGTRKEREAA